MTHSEVKEILLRCRPGADDRSEADVVAALDEVRRVPELQEWWDAQQDFHAAAAESFQHIEPPAELLERILSGNKIIKVPWWHRRGLLAAAAAIAILFGATAIYFRPPAQDTFAVFRSRMVGNVVRQYAMTINTNEMAPIREHLESRHAPADYVLPEKLGALPLAGAGVLSWQDRRVAMVCINSKRAGMMFLFVVPTDSLKQPPTGTDLSPVRTLNTVSWTNGKNTYVLAGNLSLEELRDLL